MASLKLFLLFVKKKTVNIPKVQVTLTLLNCCIKTIAKSILLHYVLRVHVNQLSCSTFTYWSKYTCPPTFHRMLTDKSRIKLSYAKHSLRQNDIIEHLIEHRFLPWSQDKVTGKVHIINVSSPGHPLSQTPARTWEKQLEVEEDQVHVTLILSPVNYMSKDTQSCANPAEQVSTGSSADG